MSRYEKAMDMICRGEAMSGLADCHIPGIYSIVFEQRQSKEVGMLRMFYVNTTAISRLITDEDFAVMPHNHRQDITLWGVKQKGVASPINLSMIPRHEVEADTKGLDLWLCNPYRFTSGLLEGEAGIEWLGRTSWYASMPTELPSDGIGLSLPASAVHTMTAPVGSAWIVEEGMESEAETFCLSLKPDKQLDSSLLYTPIDEARIKAILKRVADANQGKLSQ